ALLGKPNRLAHAIAKIKQLRPTALAAPPHHHFRDERRVQRENPLHALVVHDPPDGKCLVDPPPLAHDHGPAEHLDALLLAFDDPRVHIHRIADLELEGVLLEVILLYRFDDFVDHGLLSDPPTGVSWPLRPGHLGINTTRLLSLLVFYLSRLLSFSSTASR